MANNFPQALDRTSEEKCCVFKQIILNIIFYANNIYWIYQTFSTLFKCLVRALWRSPYSVYLFRTGVSRKVHSQLCYTWLYWQIKYTPKTFFFYTQIIGSIMGDSATIKAIPDIEGLISVEGLIPSWRQTWWQIRVPSPW